MREEILSAAMRILQMHGIKKFSQAKVAKEAGMRQSHLTYYFPKKADLIAALLQQHIQQADNRLSATDQDIRQSDMLSALNMLANNRTRMRFFMSLILEADEQPDLQKMLQDHLAQFDQLICRYFNRDINDPDVIAFLNCLRGYGMCHMTQNEDTLSQIDVQAIAHRFGLSFQRNS